jgi:S-DNA-T family DNA segregation ATPase FtsK/SpoIIIE
VATVGAALLSALAVLGGGATPLARWGHYLQSLFGSGWWLPILALGISGGLLIVPTHRAVSRLDLGAVLAAGLAVLSLDSLFGGSGGQVGAGVADVLTKVAGPVGAAILLIGIFLISLIVAFQFSLGAVILSVYGALREAREERSRMNELARSADRRGGLPVLSLKAKTPDPQLLLGGAELHALANVAAADEDPLADYCDPEPGLAAASANILPLDRLLESDEEPASLPPAFRVIADSEDDEPLIEWKLPPATLLDSITARRERMADEIKGNAKKIETALAHFGVQAKVVAVNPGPAVTQYELQPAVGVQVKRIVSLTNDLALALAASPLRIEAPIPGKSVIGIEVPNRAASIVSLREVVESPAFTGGGKTIALAIGNDVSGKGVVGDLTKMPHLLIAGATGQGKSVCINTLIASLLLQCTPDQLRLVMIDPKRVELSNYNGLPHLAVPVIVESHQAAAVLRWAVSEMDRRYKLLAAEGVRGILGYNEKAVAQRARPMPYVVIVIDELADLMMVAAGEIEELVCRIAQLARAVGIHLVIATQRPSTDIITGLIKANIPSRIAFAVSSQVDSRVILDSVGAEKLLGRGDMLYQPIDAGKPVRIQGAFVSDTEVEALIGFWKAQGAPRFMQEVLDEGANTIWEGPASERRLDPLFARAARAVAADGGASVSLVQRKFNVGYSRAGRIVDQLAENRVIGGYQGSKSREVLMNLPDIDELLERLGIE